MYKQYFAIEKKLKAKGLDMSRSELIESFTDGNKASLKHLTHREYNEFIQWLNRQDNVTQQKSWTQTKENVMRRKVISLLKSIGYTTGDDKADMKRINKWCVEYGHLHKELKEYKSTSDIAKLLNQAGFMYKKHVSAI